MKFSYPRLLAVVLSLCIAIGIVALVRKAESTEVAAINPVSLDYSCDEAKTSSSFAEFWPRFRVAVATENREELFSLSHTCGFIWDDGRGTDLPLRSEEQIRANLKLLLPPMRAINSPLVFETREDFLGSYDVMFSPAIKNRLLTLEPKEVWKGGYDISWRENGLHSLNFRRFNGIGYKFAGLQWEP